MAENVRLLSPKDVEPNPENPRLIFRQEELNALQESIQQQGILVPLTIYQDGEKYYVLDGERRWRCAVKLGLATIPVIVQPKPDRMQNLMMMFAIHHRRNEWDPLPTALKLQDLEALFEQKQGKKPTEAQLAELASLTKSEVRRYKQLLQLPQEYRDELLEELQKPRSQQVITVDQILEANRAASTLRKRGILSNEKEEDRLRRAIVDKFRSGVITNTVSPRKLLRLARGVERKEVAIDEAKKIVSRLINDPSYSIDEAFEESVEEIDFQHNFQQLVGRLSGWVGQYQERGYHPPSDVTESLKALRRQIDSILGA